MKKLNKFFLLLLGLGKGSLISQVLLMKQESLKIYFLLTFANGGIGSAPYPQKIEKKYCVFKIKRQSTFKLFYVLQLSHQLLLLGGMM